MVTSLTIYTQPLHMHINIFLYRAFFLLPYFCNTLSSSAAQSFVVFLIHFFFAATATGGAATSFLSLFSLNFVLKRF